MALTNTEIKNFKPTDKVANYADSGGLYLRVYPTGTKKFMHRSRQGGAARWTTLGEYPAMSLADARSLATATAYSTLPSHITVQSAYDEWFKRVIAKDYKTPASVAARMNLHLLPAFGPRPIRSITRTEVSAHLSTIAETAPVQANRVMSLIKLLFSYAEERGWVEHSPIDKLTKKTAGGKEKSRDRALTEAEIGRLLQVLRTDRFQDKTRWALLLMLMTGQRSGEVRGLVRSEVKDGVWTIPSARTKNRVPMPVRLPPHCMWLLGKMFAELGDKPFGNMHNEIPVRVMRKLGFEPHATPHDLRRTMATGMADLGVEPYVIEKCLNHTMAGVMAVYNRSEYAAQKKAAWRLWVKYLLGKRKAPSL